MSIGDQSRTRKTYSFFRTPPITPLSTVVSGANGIGVTGDGTKIIIFADTTFVSGNVDWTTFSASLTSTDSTANIGNGTIQAEWRKTGPQSMAVHALVTVGTTTTFGAISTIDGILMPVPPGITIDTSKILDITGGPFAGLKSCPMIVGSTTGSSNMYSTIGIVLGGIPVNIWPKSQAGALNGQSGQIVSMFVELPVLP